MLPFTPLSIDGQPRPSSTNETFEVRNPYSSKVVGTAASATSQDCKDAVEAAAKAFVTWERKNLYEKRDIFIKAADLLTTNKYNDKILAAIVEETGAVLSWAQYNIVVSTISLCRTDVTIILNRRVPTDYYDMPRVLPTN
jgi:acyl-CoA reductase-like NAD-dependent aldehyde dehydrogenase